MKWMLFTWVVTLACWLFLQVISIVQPIGDGWLTAAHVALGVMFVCLLFGIVFVIRIIRKS